MPLMALWSSNPGTVGEFIIEQVVATAGDGNLRDESACSQELRAYLAQAPSEKLGPYIQHCLTSSFSKSGMVLQDLVNELGRRLDFAVTNGRYQGTTNAVGFDGIWRSPEQQTIIVEIKTTDAYRISLDTVAGYRDKLAASGLINGPNSILVVVGRQDTGELEAQVRGSRHAWDIRLISAEALIKLVQLKENSDDPETGRNIRALLTPFEYTRLDRLIETMFKAATDIEQMVESDGPGEDEEDKEPAGALTEKGVWQFTASNLLNEKRARMIAAVGRSIGSVLVKKSRALFWSADHQTRIACTISKRYTKRNAYPYWYAFHPQWDEFLREGKDTFVVFGCMDLPFAFSIPFAVLRPVLDGLNTTQKEDGSSYWHVHIAESAPGTYSILLPKKSSSLPIDAFRVSED